MLILGLETAFEGSVAVLRESREVDSAVCQSGVSKAEEIIGLIDRLFDKNRLEKKDIGLVAFATGPGSFTGIRLGQAIVKGLQGALGIHSRGVSLLDALASHAHAQGRVMAAVQIGRGTVGWKEFELGADSELLAAAAYQTGRKDELLDRLRLFSETGGAGAIFPEGILSDHELAALKESAPGFRVSVAKQNLALLVGQRAAGKSESDDPWEFYPQTF